MLEKWSTSKEKSLKEKSHIIPPDLFNHFAALPQLVKNPPAMQEIPVRFLGREDPPGEGIGYQLQYWASLVAQTVKNLPAMQETWI